MKTIKFRVWDGERLHYPIAIMFDDTGVFWRDEKNGPIYSMGTLDGVEQRIGGAKDKHGIEIYVGDIVNVCEHSLYHSNVRKHKVCIQWNPCESAFMGVTEGMDAQWIGISGQEIGLEKLGTIHDR